VAIKTQRRISFPPSVSDIQNIDLCFGKAALAVLKFKPDYGYAFLPRIFARNESASEFGNPGLVNASAFLSLLLEHVGKQLQAKALGIVVPAFWTQRQIRIVTDACDAFDIPVRAVVDERTAIAALFSAERGSRLGRGGVHVLFVDVGATSVKAHSATFEYRDNMIVANNTAYVWSERAGSYYFARAVARAKDIPLRKAMKRVARAADLYQAELAEVARVITETYREATSNGGAIDEVQVIGGASGLPAVFDVIKRSVNGTTVRREFTAQEALARGGVLATVLKGEIVPFVPTLTHRRAVFSLNFTCNSTQVFCERGKFCPSQLVESAGGCAKAIITADASELPEGLDNVMATIEVNLSNGTGYFTFDSPDPVVTRVRRCVVGRCSPLKFVPKYGEAWELETGRFLLPWLEAHDPEERPAKGTILNRIRELLDRLSSLLDTDKDFTVEASDGVTEQMFQTYQRYSEQFKAGKIRKMSQTELNQVLTNLEAIHKTVYFT
jgi:hypothetical protein